MATVAQKQSKRTQSSTPPPESETRPTMPSMPVVEPVTAVAVEPTVPRERAAYELLVRMAGGNTCSSEDIASGALKSLAKELHLVSIRISNFLFTSEENLECEMEELAQDVAEIAYRADAAAEVHILTVAKKFRCSL